MDRDVFFTVADAFSRLVRSSDFGLLPKSFPYLRLELEQKVGALAQAHKRSDALRFRLSPDRKALLIAVRFDLASHIMDIKFSEISF